MAETDGQPSEQMIAFYTARAKGGVGLIITEITRVEDTHGRTEISQLAVDRDEVIPGLARLADSVHKYGAKIFVQLHHPGRQTSGTATFGLQPVSASVTTCKITNAEPRELSNEEVWALIDKFVDGAVRAQRAGIDGVEIHAGHGYLLNQFLSPYTNKRTDEFGGSLENRTRIISEIIKGIRLKCGSEFPIMVRTEVEEFLGSQGIELPEGVEICKLLEAAGADALNITSGIYETMNTLVEPASYKEGWRSYLVGTVKKEVSIPVCGNAVIRHPDVAEKLLQDGNQDFISMGRTHLADPEWCNKARAGKTAEIRYCISCLRCFESVFARMGLPIQCSTNPQVGREARYPYPRVDGNGRTVAVIGAGPAGMEAARVLAERRFKPVLIEKSDKLGGQLNYASVPYAQYRINWMIDYYRKQFELLKIDVRLNTAATVEYVKSLDPYAVIVATGASPIVPDSIPGIDGDNVYVTTDIIDGTVQLSGKKAVIAGSGITGLEVAEMLADAGNEVSVVEMAEKLTPDGYWQIVTDMMGRLNEKNVQFYPSHKLIGVTPDKVLLEGENTELNADAVILALGVKSQDGLYDSMKNEFEKIYRIGDASKSGKIYMATQDGFLVANNLK